MERKQHVEMVAHHTLLDTNRKSIGYAQSRLLPGGVEIHSCKQLAQLFSQQNQHRRHLSLLIQQTRS